MWPKSCWEVDISIQSCRVPLLRMQLPFIHSSIHSEPCSDNISCLWSVSFWVWSNRLRESPFVIWPPWIYFQHKSSSALLCVWGGSRRAVHKSVKGCQDGMSNHHAALVYSPRCVCTGPDILFFFYYMWILLYTLGAFYCLVHCLKWCNHKACWLVIFLLPELMLGAFSRKTRM